MASTKAKLSKDKGNVSFKAGDFADAVGHYSAAIIADRTDPTYPLNRAAAYLKLGKHVDAERDCTTVLSLDNKNVKAFFRRAQARMALEKFSDAQKDLADALRLEPSNESIRQELVAFNKRKIEVTKGKSGNEKASTIIFSKSDASGVKANVQSPKRIVRNVPIQIIEGVEPAKPETPELSTEFLTPILSRVPSSAPCSTPEPSSLVTPPLSASQSKPRVGAGIFRSDGKYTIIRNPEPTSSAANPSPPPTSLSSTHNHIVNPNSAIPPYPMTHFAFTRAWYALSTAQERYTLLQRIPPESLPTLFQTSLEPALLVSILSVFLAVASSTSHSDIIAYMGAFPAVPRFATVILFLSAEEKAVVQKIWDLLGIENEDKRKIWGV